MVNWTTLRPILSEMEEIGAKRRNLLFIDSLCEGQGSTSHLAAAWAGHPHLS
jgi:hypothetical protein